MTCEEICIMRLDKTLILTVLLSVIVLMTGITAYCADSGEGMPVSQEQTAEFEAAADALSLRLGLNELSDYLRIKTVYDYICCSVEYASQNENGISPDTAYSALILGKGTDKGYAALCGILCSRGGIECRAVTGAENGCEHVCNIVKLNGSYYLLDCCWDAGNMYTGYSRFLRGGYGDFVPDDASGYTLSGSDYIAGANDLSCGGKCGDSLYWSIDGGELSISGEGRMWDFTIPWSDVRGGILSFAIDGRVKSIPDYAFCGCVSADCELALPAGLEYIGDRAFCGCGLLYGSAVFSSDLTYIGDYAFYGCESLEGGISLPDSVSYVGEYAFCGCGSLDGELVLSSSVTEIKRRCFSGCVSLIGDLTVPDSVLNINEGAFEGCLGFDGELTLSENLLYIADSAFSGCSSLTGDLIIPNGVLSVGENAFLYCCSFDGEIVIPQSLMSIGALAFGKCMNLSGELLIPEGVISMGNCAFTECTSFDGRLYIPSSVKNIGYGAFLQTTGFSRIEVDDSNTEFFSAGNCLIDKYGVIVAGCRNSVIPDDDFVSGIGENAFYGCRNFSGAIVIPDNISVIGDCAFFSSTAFRQTIEFGAGVVSIGEKAFSGCGSVSAVIFSGDVPSCGKDAFYGCGNGKQLTVYYDADNQSWADAVDAECSLWTSSGGDVYKVSCESTAADGECGENLFWSLSNNGILTISGSGDMDDYDMMWNLPPWFDYVNDITSIVIEKGITSVGNYAFAGCMYVPGCVEIPASVNSIGEGAFLYCLSLEAVRFDGNAPGTGYGAFDYCSENFRAEYPRGNSSWENSVENGLWNGYDALSYRPKDKTADVSGDGKVSVTDAVYLLWALCGRSGYTIDAEWDCDYDGNGVLNMADAVYLLWHIFYPAEFYIQY